MPVAVLFRAPERDMPETGTVYVSEPTPKPGIGSERCSCRGPVDHPDTTGQFAVRRGPRQRASLLAGATSLIEPCRPARTARSAGVRRLRSVAALIYYGQLPQLLHFAAPRDREARTPQ